MTPGLLELSFNSQGLVHPALRPERDAEPIKGPAVRRELSEILTVNALRFARAAHPQKLCTQEMSRWKEPIVRLIVSKLVLGSDRPPQLRHRIVRSPLDHRYPRRNDRDRNSENGPDRVLTRRGIDWHRFGKLFQLFQSRTALLESSRGGEGNGAPEIDRDALKEMRKEAGQTDRARQYLSPPLVNPGLFFVPH